MVGCWVGGLLGCWVGLLDCWFVGLLLCWSVGLLVCCCPGLLDSQPGPAECAKRLNPPPLGRRLESHSHLSVPGRVSLPYPPAGRAHSVGRPSPSASRRHPRSFFNPCFSVRISVGHVDGPTNHFFEKFLDFWWSRRRFSTILGPKTGPRGSLFRCFFKNDDFVEIVLPLWWEHSFQGLDLPKIDLEIDYERQRRTTSKKIASDAVSERTFSVPGLVFGRFWGPTWVTGHPLWADFRATFVTFS